MQPRQAGMRIARLGGIPIIISPSWLLSVLVIVILASPIVQQSVAGVSAMTAYLASLTLAILLGISVLAHELGHTLVARAMNIRVLSIRLHLVGGVSELAQAPRSPKQEALIAAAGPAVSGLLAVVSGLFIGGAEPHTVTWLILLQITFINALIAIFNILPALPLDGGRVLRALVWGAFGRQRTGTIAGVLGGILVAIGLVVAAAYFALSDTRLGWWQAGIAAIVAASVGGGALAEWPKQDANPKKSATPEPTNYPDHEGNE